MVAVESSRRMNDTNHASQTSVLGPAWLRRGKAGSETGTVFPIGACRRTGLPGEVARHAALTRGQRASGLIPLPSAPKARQDLGTGTPSSWFCL